MITTNDLNALIAFSIQNNKPGTIKAMNSAGYPVLSNISDASLFNAVQKVYTDQGLSALKQVLNMVPTDKSKLTQEQAKNLLITYKNLQVDPNAKFGDFLQSLGSGIGDFLSGHTTVSTSGGSTIITPTLSSGTLLFTAIAGVILIAIFRKFTAVIVAIVIIVAAVVLYGIFSKNITSTGPTATTQSNAGALGWLKGILSGLNLSVIGG